MEPNVSIIVPVKNSEATIKDCINSLLNLNYRRKKIYVIDNMSTDKTYEILKKFGKKIILKRMSGNVPKVYNKILKEINTEYVALTDSDVVVDKNWLNALIKEFRDDDVAAVGGICKTPKNDNLLQRLIGYDLDYRFEMMKDGEVNRLPTMNLCFKKKILDEIGGFDENLDVAYDTEIGYRIKKYGYKILYTKKAIVYHFHRSNLKRYAKQKFKTGTFLPQLYFKVPKGLKGDNVNPSLMIIQPFLFGLFLLSITLSLINNKILFLALGLLIILFLAFLYRTIKLYQHYKRIEVFLNLLLYWYWVFFVTFGIIFGIFKLLRLKKR